METSPFHLRGYMMCILEGSEANNIKDARHQGKNDNSHRSRGATHLVISINNNPETQVRALPPPPSIREGRAERESLGMLFNVHGKSERGVEYFKINFVFQSIINSLES